MSGFNSRQFSDYCAVVATIDPQGYTSGTQNSDWVNMANFEGIAFILQTGVLAGTTGTITAKLQQGTNSTGGSAKDVASSSITALGATDDDDSQVVIQCRGDVLDTSGGFDYVRLQATILTTASSGVSAVGIGYNPYHAPASDNDLASVKEIVTCTS